MNFWEKIKQHNTQLLLSEIESKGGKAEANVESILENLRYLAEEGDDFDEKKRFIRLDVRRALASLCDTGRIVFTLEPSTIKWAEDMSSVSLAGYLYEVRDDGTKMQISSLACGGAARQDVYSYDSMTNPQRQALMFSLASARAESNAYFNSGIGIEYKGGDVFDLEAFENRIPAPEPVMPETPSAEEKKQKRATRAKKEKAKEQPATGENSNVTETEAEAPAIVAPVTEEPEVVAAPVEPEAVKPAGAMTYEDALEVAVDCGTFNGTPIGEILSDERKARNIVWCFKQDIPGRTPETKMALSVAIEGYKGGVLKRLL